MASQKASWNATNEDKVRAANLWHFYRLRPERYNAILKAQGGVCAICQKPPKGKGKEKYLHVDHDHLTSAVRGLLCGECNTGLGKFRDDPDLLIAAAEYLLKD
jgi:hypothetical protein